MKLTQDNCICPVNDSNGICSCLCKNCNARLNYVLELEASEPSEQRTLALNQLSDYDFGLFNLYASW